MNSSDYSVKGGGGRFWEWALALALTMILAYAGYNILKASEDYEFYINVRDREVNATKLRPSCANNSECGTSMYVGSIYCSGKFIVRDYVKAVCENPGTVDSVCVNETKVVKINFCEKEGEVCMEGECTRISCTNGELDLGEMGVDCGGECKSCDENKSPTIPSYEKCVDPDDSVYRKILEVKVSRNLNDPEADAGIDWVKVTYGRTRGQDSGYRGLLAAVVNEYGTVLCAEYFSLENNNSITISLPYKPGTDKFVVTQQNRVIDERKIVDCNQNGICEPALGETYLACVQDCPEK